MNAIEKEFATAQIRVNKREAEVVLSSAKKAIERGGTYDISLQKDSGMILVYEPDTEITIGILEENSRIIDQLDKVRFAVGCITDITNKSLYLEIMIMSDYHICHHYPEYRTRKFAEYQEQNPPKRSGILDY